MFNGILAAQERLLAAWDKTVTEEPPGEKQIDYHEDSGQWVPRGDVLRCIIDDGGPEGEVTIHIDDKELSLAEFGRLLTGSCGLGHEDRVRARGIRHRESDRQGAQARAAEGAREALTQSETLGTQV